MLNSYTLRHFLFGPILNIFDIFRQKISNISFWRRQMFWGLFSKRWNGRIKFDYWWKVGFLTFKKLTTNFNAFWNQSFFVNIFLQNEIKTWFVISTFLRFYICPLIFQRFDRSYWFQDFDLFSSPSQDFESSIIFGIKWQVRWQ